MKFIPDYNGDCHPGDKGFLAAIFCSLWPENESFAQRHGGSIGGPARWETVSMATNASLWQPALCF